jgi:histidine phosphotransferase ChpT
VKLAFLLVLCVASALPWGGDDRVRRTGERLDDPRHGRTMKRRPRALGALGIRTRRSTVSSAEVEFPLAREAAQRIGAAVGVEIGTGRISVTF